MKLTRVIEQPDLISSDSSTNIDSKCLKIYNRINIENFWVNKNASICQLVSESFAVYRCADYLILLVPTQIQRAKSMPSNGTFWSSSVKSSPSIGWLRNCRGQHTAVSQLLFKRRAHSAVSQTSVVINHNWNILQTAVSQKSGIFWIISLRRT